MWITIKNKVDEHTVEILELKNSVIVLSNTNNDIQVRLAQIQTDLSWIKDKLNK